MSAAFPRRCVSCKKLIPTARLRAVPQANACVACTERIEKADAMREAFKASPAWNCPTCGYIRPKRGTSGGASCPRCNKRSAARQKAIERSVEKHRPKFSKKVRRPEKRTPKQKPKPRHRSIWDL